MKSKRILAALAASAGLLWATAHANDEARQAMPELPPGIIIFELQPAPQGAVPQGPMQGAPESGQPHAAQPSEQELIMSMLLMQLLSGMEGPPQGGAMEMPASEPEGVRI